MYWSADGMMIVAKAVITGHHWASFQSVQKSQSPANNCLVISAAPATTKIAVTQNTRSHFRSIHLYCFCSSALSSSRRCRSAASAMVVVPAAMVASSLCADCWVQPSLGRVSVGCGVRTEWGFCGRHLFGLLNLEQAQNGLSPHGEHPAGQPAVHHEWPVEGNRKKLLGDPQTVTPFVEGDFHAFKHGGGDQQEKRPGKTLVSAVECGNAKPPVEVGTQGQDDREREEEVEHGNVGGRERGIAHHRLMPRAVPVRPEAGLDINRETGGADEAPQNRDPPYLFSALVRLPDDFPAGPDQPAVPDAGKHA